MMTDSNYATFTLRLTGIDLDNIHPNDVGALLSDFSRLLNEDSLKFDSVRQGSAVVSVRANQELYPQILQNFQNGMVKSAYKSLTKTIRKYAKLFPDIQAELWAKPNNKSENQLIETLDYQEYTKTIKQTETLIGKLQKPAHGKDDTDHFTILLANGNQVAVKVNKILSHELAGYLEGLWLADSLIEFTGIAKYQLTGWQMKLSEFTAQSFVVLPNKNELTKWADDFHACGESGWRALDNPEQTWLMERHSS